MTNEGIDFELIFDNPFSVSQDSEPDMVKLLLDLSEFRAKNGERMQSTILEVLIPRQLNGESGAIMVSAAAAVDTASTAAVGTNFLVNLLLSASLNQLWSMLNGLQIFVHMPLMDVRFPANANTFIVFLVNIANFDIIPTDYLFGKIFNFPDDGAFNLNF